MDLPRKARAAALVVVLSLPALAARADDRPLSLADVVQLAQSRNERATIARLQVDEANAQVAAARARFLPAVSLSVGDEFRPERLGATSTAPVNAGTASLNLQQPIFDLAAFPLLAEARDALAAQQDATAEDQRTLAFDASRAFFGVLTAQSVLQAALRELDTAKATVDDAHARVKAGLTSVNDETRATVDLVKTEGSVAHDCGAADDARLLLGFVIAAPPPSSLTRPDALVATAQKPVTDDASLVRLALGRRLDLSALQHAARAAHDAAAEPPLRIVPTLGFSGSTSATTATGDTGQWSDASLAVTLTWVLFDAGRRAADESSRDAAAKIADLQALSEARQVESDVRRAAVALKTAQASYEIAERAVAVAKTDADETSALYKQGLARAIELVDANDQLFLAEVSDVEARDELALAYLDLRQALGLDPLGLELR